MRIASVRRRWRRHMHSGRTLRLDIDCIVSRVADAIVAYSRRAMGRACLLRRSDSGSDIHVAAVFGQLALLDDAASV
jgi:hypothetical protein